MRKRRVVLAVAILALVGITACALALTAPWSSRKRIRQVREGMSLEEVRAILTPERAETGRERPLNALTWDLGSCGVTVWFGSDGKAKVIQRWRKDRNLWEQSLNRLADWIWGRDTDQDADFVDMP
jgi:hypothetical protein